MFSTKSKTETIIQLTFDLTPANAFNLVNTFLVRKRFYDANVARKKQASIPYIFYSIELPHQGAVQSIL